MNIHSVGNRRSDCLLFPWILSASFLSLLLVPPQDPIDRPQQILDAALRCFARKGFHQTTMHDVSAEAGISVGLIYRYFDNKEALISGMADAHKAFIDETMSAARNAPNLVEAIEIFFAQPCDDSPAVEAAFLVDLFAEASRSPRVAAIVQDVALSVRSAFVELIENAPEARPALSCFTAEEMAELICAVHHGLAVNELIVPREPSTDAERIGRQLHMVRNLCAMLFSGACTVPPRNAPAHSMESANL